MLKKVDLMQKRADFFMLDLISIRHGRIRSDFARLGPRGHSPLGPSRRARPLGRPHGRAPLSGVSTVCRSGSALRGRIPETVAGPDRPAIGRLQVPAPRPLDRLAPAAAVPPLAADCQQHPNATAVSAARGSQPGLLCHGRQSAAFERRLAGGLRPSAGVGRDLRGPEALRRHALIGPETGGRSGAPEAFPAATAATPSSTATSRRWRVYPLRSGARQRLRDPQPSPSWEPERPSPVRPPAAGPALVAAGVPGHPGSPSSPGPQVPVAHSAGPLGVGSAVRLPGSRCHLAFCRRAEPGGTAQPRRLAKSQDRSLRPSLSGHPASSDDRHRPQAVSIGPSALGGAPATCPHRSGGRRQTSAGRQSSRRRPLPARGKSRHGIRPGLHPGGLRCSSVTYSRYAPSERLVRRAQPRSRCSRDFHHGLLRNRVSGSPRQRDAHRQPPLHRRGGRDCGRPGPAGGGRRPRRGDHSGRLAHHPQHPPRPPASPGAPTICSRSRATRPKPTKPWRPSTGTGTPLPASPKTPSRPMAASKIAGSRS